MQDMNLTELKNKDDFYYNFYNCEELDLMLDYHYTRINFSKIINNLFEFIESKNDKENLYLLCCNDLKEIFLRKQYGILLYILRCNEFNLDGNYIG